MGSRCRPTQKAGRAIAAAAQVLHSQAATKAIPQIIQSRGEDRGIKIVAAKERMGITQKRRMRQNCSMEVLLSGKVLLEVDFVPLFLGN